MPQSPQGAESVRDLMTRRKTGSDAGQALAARLDPALLYTEHDPAEPVLRVEGGELVEVTPVYLYGETLPAPPDAPPPDRPAAEPLKVVPVSPTWERWAIMILLGGVLSLNGLALLGRPHPQPTPAPVPSPVTPPTPTPTPTPVPVPAPAADVDPAVRSAAAAYFGRYPARYGADAARIAPGVRYPDLMAAQNADRDKLGVALGQAINALVFPLLGDDQATFKDPAAARAAYRKVSASLAAGLADAAARNP